jgi:hypothetical protein
MPIGDTFHLFRLKAVVALCRGRGLADQHPDFVDPPFDALPTELCSCHRDQGVQMLTAA